MKAIHYINQFFGQVGGEAAAETKPLFHDSPIGCSLLLDGMMDDVEITHTLVCGDNYITNNTEEAYETIFAWLDTQEFDMFFAGPAFMAGRYGMGCGGLSKAVAERYGVPAITSMNEENPGVAEYRSDCYIFKGGGKAHSMKKDLAAMAAFAEKIAQGKELLSAQEEGYFSRGIRSEIPAKDGVMAADRVIDLLLKKLNGEPFETELIIPKTDQIPPAPAVKDLSAATIALVSSSGVVPFDNPDKIQSASAQKWGKYSVVAKDCLPPKEYKTIHAGFDPAAICAVPDRGIPLDAMRAYEREGKFARLYDYYYVTVGTGTTQNYAAKFGREIAAELKKAQVDAVILTAT